MNPSGPSCREGDTKGAISVAHVGVDVPLCSDNALSFCLSVICGNDGSKKQLWERGEALLAHQSTEATRSQQESEQWHLLSAKTRVAKSSSRSTLCREPNWKLLKDGQQEQLERQVGGTDRKKERERERERERKSESETESSGMAVGAETDSNRDIKRRAAVMVCR